MKTLEAQIDQVTSDTKTNPLYSSKEAASERDPGSMKAQTYGVTSYRWVILVIYSLCNMVGGFVQVPFSACSPAVAEIYNTSQDVVGLTTEVFIILYVPFNFPSVWIIDNWGIITGMVITVAGIWVRLVVILQPSFYWILAGQVLGGIAGPFLQNATAKVGSTWFAPKERALATSLGAVFLQLGSAVALVLPIYYFKEQEQYVGRHEQGHQDMARYLWLWTYIGSAVLVLTLILFKKKPSIPPSASSEMDRAPVCRSVLKLFKNLNFIIMLIGYTLIYGIYSIIGACISFFTSHYGFSIFDTGYLALTFILGGLVGSTFFSLIVLKTSKYKCVFFLCSLFTNIGLSFCILCLIGGREYLAWAYIAFFFTGFNMIPVIPLSYDFGSEIGYPVSEAAVCGTLVVIAQVWGAVAYFIVIAIKSVSVPMSMWTMVISSGIGFIFVIFVKETLKRKDADDKAGLLQNRLKTQAEYTEIH